mgnify:FL=1
MTLSAITARVSSTILNQIGRQAARETAAVASGARTPPAGVDATLKTLVNKTAWLFGASRTQAPASREKCINALRDDIDRQSRALCRLGEKIIGIHGALLERRMQASDLVRLEELGRQIKALEGTVSPDGIRTSPATSAVVMDGPRGPTLEAHSPVHEDTPTCLFTFDMEDTLTRMGVDMSALDGSSPVPGARQVDARALGRRVASARLNQLNTPHGNEWTMVSKLERYEAKYLAMDAALGRAKLALREQIMRSDAGAAAGAAATAVGTRQVQPMTTEL